MYRVDCREIASYEDFIEVFNKALIEPAGGKWSGNLDAFNDYLSWPKKAPYKLEIIGTARCEQVLNYVAHERHEKALWQLIREIFLDNQKLVLVEFH